MNFVTFTLKAVGIVLILFIVSLVTRVAILLLKVPEIWVQPLMAVITVVTAICLRGMVVANIILPILKMVGIEEVVEIAGKKVPLETFAKVSFILIIIFLLSLTL